MDGDPSGELAGRAGTDTVGNVAGLLGIVSFALRLAFALIPGVPGAVGQLVGLALGTPAVVLGIISLSRPRHRTSLAVVGVVLGALVAVTGTIGVGIAA